MIKNKIELLGGTLAGMMFLSGCAPSMEANKTPTEQTISTGIPTKLPTELPTEPLVTATDKIVTTPTESVVFTAGLPASSEAARSIDISSTLQMSLAQKVDLQYLQEHPISQEIRRNSKESRSVFDMPYYNINFSGLADSIISYRTYTENGVKMDLLGVAVDDSHILYISFNSARVDSDQNFEANTKWGDVSAEKMVEKISNVDKSKTIVNFFVFENLSNNSQFKAENLSGWEYSQVVDQKLDEPFEVVSVTGAKGNLNTYGELIFNFVSSWKYLDQDTQQRLVTKLVEISKQTPIPGAYIELP
jgi:hypothetical protein